MPQIDFEKLTDKIERFTPLWFDEFTRVTTLANEAEADGKLIDIYASSSTIDLIKAVVSGDIDSIIAREGSNKLLHALRALERQGYVLDYTRSQSFSIKPPSLYRNDLYTTFHWVDDNNPYIFEAYISVPTGLAWPFISLGYGLLKPG